MPLRLEPFLNNCIYHVFNKTIDKKRVFENDDNCHHFYETLRYYRSNKATVSYSKLSRLQSDIYQNLIKQVSLHKYFKIEILAYCLMPTHFHLLIKQKLNNGTQRVVSDILNSFTHYFNIKRERKGPIFLPKFKSVMIRTDEQLIHVSRYIHLNIYSSGLTNLEGLRTYKWSSYKTYINKIKDELVDTERVLSLFNFNRERYKKFVESNAEYQKTLERVKYAEKW